MRPGREIDTQISQEVMGYQVKIKAKEPWEVTPLGERPLRKYSKEIAAAWEVAEKMNVTLIPVQVGAWFALAGKAQRFQSPDEFIKMMSEKDYAQTGAAADENPALAICQAALKAVANRKAVPSRESMPEPTRIH